MGNLQSVLNASNYIGGCDSIITKDPKIIEEADGLILPGVGAFEDAMKELKSRKLIDVLNKEVLIQKKPILGICLGMQLLFQRSEENGRHEGLSWLEGTVNRFEIPMEYQIPHIGWNDFHHTSDNIKILSQTEKKDSFYFIHSYYVDCPDSLDYCSTVHEGFEFKSMVQVNNIYATQFHPEKSQDAGLKILNEFNKL